MSECLVLVYDSVGKCPPADRCRVQDFHAYCTCHCVAGAHHLIEKSPGVYQQLIKMSASAEYGSVIKRDVTRTFFAHPLFVVGDGERMLERVLTVYSIFDPGVGYCQGDKNTIIHPSLIFA